MIIKNFFQKLGRRFSALFKQEEGLSMVYLALTLMTFLSLAGLAIDGSNSFAQYRELQTAADAAALAGARALALDQSSAQVSSEAQTIAALNGADSATPTILNDNHNVAVTVQRNVDTYFAKLVGFSNISVNAEAEAGFRSIAGVTEQLFPMTVECDCVEQNKTIEVIAPIKSYCVSDVTEYYNNIQFALWLSNFDPLVLDPNGPKTYFHTTDDSGRMVEHDDGTATLSYVVRNPDGDGFQVNATLSERQSKPPTGSPKFGPVITDATNWYYYKNLSGTLTGLSGTRYAGAKIDISRRGPAFQVGLGADFHEGNQFGGAAWLNLTTIKQPKKGVILPLIWNQADINVRFRDCTESPGGSTTASSCNFQWLDWNGGTSTQSELSANIQDLTNSGTKHVGEWVSTGINSDGGVSLAVQNSFHSWLGKPFTIPLYTGEVSGSNQIEICGFAQMVVNSYDLEYNVNSMSVQFEPAVIRGETLGDESADDYGVRDLVLIR